MLWHDGAWLDVRIYAGWGSGVSFVSVQKGFDASVRLEVERKAMEDVFGWGGDAVVKHSVIW